MYQYNDGLPLHRRHTIVLNLDELRCLLLYDRLIVIVPEGADPDW